MKKIILASVLLSSLLLSGCAAADPISTAKILGGKLVSSVCALKTETTVTQKYIDETTALANEYDKAVGPKNEKNDWLNFATESKALRVRAEALKPLLGVKFTKADNIAHENQCKFITNAYNQEFDALK